MNNRMQLPTIAHCTGCQACRVVCPVNAISMKENERGDIYPIIQENICIKCNKCVRVCPELSLVKLNTKNEKVYAMWVNSSKNRKYSTSGGASYILSRTIIERGGVFCGVIYKNGGAEHKICNCLEELPYFQGSKYTHSNVKDVYKEIETLLKVGKQVLFTGTPCQVAALRSYLRKDYELLYCIDILCHGVPSKKVLRNRISYIENKKNKSIVDIRFREKTPDQYNTCMKYIFKDGTSYMCSEFEDPYIRSFEKSLIIRQNCFNCRYKKAERVSDITIADFWGYKPHNLKFRSSRKGTSLLIVNTEKGNKIFNLIQSDITIDRTRTFDEAAKYNSNLFKLQQQPADYDKFWTKYLQGETLEELQATFYPCIHSNKISYINRLKQLLKLTLSTLGIYKIK